MKIIVCSDIHGAYNRVGWFLAKESPIDILVIAGDLTTRGSAQEAAAALRSFSVHARRIVTVAGNMDLPALAPVLAGASEYVDGRGAVIDDIGFFGVSGSPATPFGTPWERTEEELSAAAEAGWRDVATAPLRIMIPHAPPHDTVCDRLRSGGHAGSRTLRTFIERHQPAVVLCGHIHEARGIDRIGRSEIVNCGAAGTGSYAKLTVQGTNVQVELCDDKD